ncbi:MAG TPA: nuclear transport factor 2 family protein [Hyphomonadaceae bacterium]|jgi:ketosteroid isomerase-like protein|nr:nuclear transport factor 2 family protein [Hyphomonadaceae bacterium]
MNADTTHDLSAMQLPGRMFEVEMVYIASGAGDLGRAFHPDVVVHEPATLPYPGDWKGPDGVGALFHKMREVWSEMRVQDMQAVREGDRVYMAGTIHLTSRATGASAIQPFAEVLQFRNGLLIEGTPFYFDTGELDAILS